MVHGLQPPAAVLAFRLARLVADMRCPRPTLTDKPPRQPLWRQRSPGEPLGGVDYGVMAAAGAEAADVEEADDEVGRDRRGGQEIGLTSVATPRVAWWH